MREVPRYAHMVDGFFNEIDSYQAISDHELHFYLNEFSKFQQNTQSGQTLGATVRSNVAAAPAARGEVSSCQVLMQLYEYYEKFEQPINALLGQQQCSVLLPVHHRLVQIRELLNNQNSSGMGTMRFDGGQAQYNTLNPNPYQQPVNCYATSSEINSFQGNSSAFCNTINNQNFLFSSNINNNNSSNNNNNASNS